MFDRILNMTLIILLWKLQVYPIPFFSHLIFSSFMQMLWRDQGGFIYILKFIWKWLKENLDLQNFVIFELGLNNLTILGQCALLHPLRPIDVLMGCKKGH